MVAGRLANGRSRGSVSGVKAASLRKMARALSTTDLGWTKPVSMPRRASARPSSYQADRAARRASQASASARLVIRVPAARKPALWPGPPSELKARRPPSRPMPSIDRSMMMARKSRFSASLDDRLGCVDGGERVLKAFSGPRRATSAAREVSDSFDLADWSPSRRGLFGAEAQLPGVVVGDDGGEGGVLGGRGRGGGGVWAAAGIAELERSRPATAATTKRFIGNPRMRAAWGPERGREVNAVRLLPVAKRWGGGSEPFAS